MPTPQAIAGQPVADSKVRKAIYDRANSEIAKLDGVQSAKVTAELVGEGYQALAELVIVKDGKTNTVNFLIKPDGTLLLLGNKTPQLNWSFDGSGTAVWSDKAGNIFGKVNQTKGYEDWQVRINGYGIVAKGGLKVGGTSFAEGQPLLVKVTKDSYNHVIAISVQLKPGAWVDISSENLGQLDLSDEAITEAKVVTLPTPTKEPTKSAEQLKPAPVKLMTYGGETDFATLPPTYDNAMKGFSEIAEMKHHAGEIVIRLYKFPGGQGDYDLIIAGKPSQTRTTLENKQIYVFEPQKVYYADPSLREKGPFIIEFMTVNRKGIDVNVRLKLPALSKMYVNFPLPRLWDFYEVPNNVYAGGLVRGKQGDKGDIVGFAKPSLIQRYIDTAIVQGPNVIIDIDASTWEAAPLVLFPF